ncbi:MAG: polyprenyl synthetase family protein [Bacilli bacterium]|jgi:heptaprenyl diphosphate synthase|nr:polyprenyl synthetase family protein [Bacilli bacterium]
MSTIFEEYPIINNKLNEVKKTIDDRLTTSEIKFSKVVRSIFNENSKLIRPSLVLIASEYNENVSEKAISLAAAVEMMHVASLVHDDIIDNAKTRRNQPTINEQYDIGYAVICGDYLFSKAFEIIFESQDLKGISKMGNNVTNMVFGEVEQYLDKYNQEINVERYLSMIEKKTASFFATSLTLGAYLAKVKQKEIDLLELIGKNMGMLFQIQDDLLDFKSNNITGKTSNMSDLKRGIYSLPIIIAMENDLKFKEYLKSEDINYDNIKTYLTNNKALEKCDDYIQKYYQETIKLINELSNNNVKEKLNYLVNKLLRREK